MLRIAKHFPYFLALAEERGFHRAAQRLNIAQSALSRRIAELERDLDDTSLFHRTARGVTITDAGRALAEDVRRIMLDVEQAARRAVRVGQGQQGQLAIAFTEAMIRRPLLAAGVRAFRNAYPDIDLKAEPLTSDRQRARLRGGEIDIGFVIEEPDDALAFRTLHLGADRVVAALPLHHALARQPGISLPEIAREPLILPSRAHAPRLFGRIMAAFDACGLLPHVAVEFGANDVGFGLAAAGLGIALAVVSPDDACPDTLVMREPVGLDLHLSLALMWRRNDASPPVSNFVRIIAGLTADHAVPGRATIGTVASA